MRLQTYTALPSSSFFLKGYYRMIKEAPKAREIYKRRKLCRQNKEMADLAKSASYLAKSISHLAKSDVVLKKVVKIAQIEVIRPRFS